MENDGTIKIVATYRVLVETAISFNTNCVNFWCLRKIITPNHNLVEIYFLFQNNTLFQVCMNTFIVYE